MRQEEIDEISEAFGSAWKEYFGDEMYYVLLDLDKTVIDTLYREQKNKVYDYEHKKLFHGTLKESPAMDEMRQTGKRVNKTFEISFVTKELVDLGVEEIDTNAIIQYIDRFNKTHTYRIYDEFQKVQFSDNKIFTKLLVVPVDV